MARLRDSYAGTSGAEGGFGALPLGLLAEMRTRQASGVVCRRGSLAVGHSQPNVPVPGQKAPQSRAYPTAATPALMASVVRSSHQQPRPCHDYRDAQELTHRHPIKRHRTKMDIRLTIKLHKESEDAITQQEETAYLAGPPRFRRKTPDNNEKNDAL